ncbi:MAG: ATP-binding protein [Sulfuritalea sp.]|nr:ATP-binding protein [Sulfuritalea sp.]
MNSIGSMLSRDQEPRLAECETHGAYESRNLFRSVWSGCPQCGAEREAQEKTERERKGRSEWLAAWQRKIGSAGIPERFRDRSLESFVAETDAKRRALDFALSYADDFDSALEIGRSALFIGGVGTGKTHLAAGIGLHIMARNSRTVLFSTVMRAIRLVKDTWNKEADQTETEAIATLTAPDLLILDEVGVQFGSETEKLILFDVLNERYEKRRPTLLLSNLDLGGVRTYLGERVFDRIREDGGEVVIFDWQSHRGRG